MASPLSGVGDSLFRLGESRRAKQSESLDALIKQAQLKEMGYQVQQKPGGFFGGGQTTLVQDPNFVSTKALERQKLQQDLEDQKSARDAMFGGGSVTGAIGPKPIAKSIKFGGQEFINPAASAYELEQKRLEDAQKPLSDTGSNRLSAAEQSLANIKRVREMATPQRFGEMKSGFSKIRMGNKLGVTNSESVMGNVLNGATFGLAKLPFQTNDDQKEFENNISTLVEGQLRARTGAAAPQSEIDREVSRILSSDDSLNSFLSKLSNAEKYVVGLAEGIRPGSSKPFVQPQAQIPEGVNPNEYAQAKALGYSDQEIIDYLRSLHGS